MVTELGTIYGRVGSAFQVDKKTLFSRVMQSLLTASALLSGATVPIMINTSGGCLLSGYGVGLSIRLKRFLPK